MQHLNGAVPSACALRPDLPAEYDAFFKRALSKQPDGRFQTPQEFMEAVDQLPIGPAVPAPAQATHPGHSFTGAALGAQLVASTGQTFAITAPELVIGRSDPQRGHRPDIDLLALDPVQTVSRRHAQLAQRDGHFFIEDLNAYNRTRVNGVVLTPHQEMELHSGDVVRLGNVELRLDARGR
jgi:serine/threonine-protein kinase